MHHLLPELHGDGHDLRQKIVNPLLLANLHLSRPPNDRARDVTGFRPPMRRKLGAPAPARCGGLTRVPDTIEVVQPSEPLPSNRREIQ